MNQRELFYAAAQRIEDKGGLSCDALWSLSGEPCAWWGQLLANHMQELGCYKVSSGTPISYFHNPRKLRIELLRAYGAGHRERIPKILRRALDKLRLEEFPQHHLRYLITQPSAESAARVLDDLIPDWAMRLDMETFNFNCIYGCILGQLGGYAKIMELSGASDEEQTSSPFNNEDYSEEDWLPLIHERRKPYENA